MQYYDRGDIALITDTLTPSVNPGVSTFSVINPAGTTTSYIVGTAAEATNPSTGVVRLRLPIPDTEAAEGVWYVRSVATGNGAGAVQAAFEVRPWPN